MRPGEILDAQIDLLDRLEGDLTFKRVMHQWADLELTRRVTGAGMIGDVDPDAVVTVLRNHVRGAEAYRVTHDMSIMLQHVASELDNTDQFLPDLAPSGCGFVCFDRPLPMLDVRGQQMLIHWLVWGPASFRENYGGSRTGTMYWTFNDTWREPDEVAQRQEREWEAEGIPEEQREAFRRAVGRWGLVGTDMGFPEQRMGPMILSPGEEQRAKLLAEGVEAQPGTNVLRYLHALWLLLGQTISRVEPEVPDRKAARRAIRKKLPPRVTVIRLRREASSEGRPEGESMVEWAHRWIVRGHPRWQPYGPRTADHTHVLGPHQVGASGKPERWCVYEGCEHHVARIFIHPYEKGPEGAPLVQSKKVYSLDR